MVKPEGYPYSLIVFDLDGTLTTTKSGRAFPRNLDDRVALPGRVEGCRRLRRAGVRLALATNQGGIAYGYWPYPDLRAAIEVFVLNEFFIRPSYVALCPHHPSGTVEHFNRVCTCRKPAPGMLLRLIERAGVEPSSTLYVGDQESDKQAAEAAGVDFAWAANYFEEVNQEPALALQEGA